MPAIVAWGIREPASDVQPATGSSWWTPTMLPSVSLAYTGKAIPIPKVMCVDVGSLETKMPAYCSS